MDIGEPMVTYLHKHKDASTCSQTFKSTNNAKDASSNVVAFKSSQSKKDQARAKLLRAAQKIRW